MVARDTVKKGRVEFVTRFVQANANKTLSTTKNLTRIIDNLKVARIMRGQLIDVILDNIDINYFQKGNTSGTSKNENVYRKFLLGGTTHVKVRIVEVKSDFICLIFSVHSNAAKPFDIFAVALNYKKPQAPNANWDKGMWFKVFTVQQPNSEQTTNASFVVSELAKHL